MTQSGYFRLANTVELGMGITDGKLLLCHGISEGSVEKKVSTRDLKIRTVYDWLNNTFPDDCVIPDLNLPPINIEYRTLPYKILCYTSDLIPDAITVASEKYVSTLTTPSD